jgi:hypothetical protein
LTTLSDAAGAVGIEYGAGAESMPASWGSRACAVAVFATSPVAESGSACVNV